MAPTTMTGEPCARELAAHGSCQCFACDHNLSIDGSRPHMRGRCYARLTNTVMLSALRRKETWRGGGGSPSKRRRERHAPRLRQAQLTSIGAMWSRKISWTLPKRAHRLVQPGDVDKRESMTRTNAYRRGAPYWGGGGSTVGVLEQTHGGLLALRLLLLRQPLPLSAVRLRCCGHPSADQPLASQEVALRHVSMLCDLPGCGGNYQRGGGLEGAKAGWPTAHKHTGMRACMGTGCAHGQCACVREPRWSTCGGGCAGPYVCAGSHWRLSALQVMYWPRAGGWGRMRTSAQERSHERRARKGFSTALGSATAP